MKLAAYGDRAWLELADGSHLYAGSPRDAVLYDAEGVYWPKRSVLIGPYERGTKKAPSDAAARRYFGKTYELREGRARLPPKELALWKKLPSRARRVFYRRRGHGGARVWLVFGGEPAGTKFHPFAHKPLVYTRGRWIRIELERGLDGRGFLD